jgi:type II secretory pathway component PulF
MLFYYKGLDANGKTISSRIEAESKEIAVEKIKNIGIYIENIKEINEQGFVSNIRDFFHHRYNKMPISFLSAMSKELSIYLKSGMNLTQALTLLKDQQENAKMTQFIEHIYKLMIEGSSFSDALKDQNIYFLPEFYLKTIEASESSGNLEKVLDQLSSLLRDNEKMENEVQNALVYPIFIFVMAMFVVIFLINYVIPKISKIFEQMKQELPWSTQIVVGLGNFMQEWGGFLFFVFLFVTIILMSIIKANENIQIKIDKMILKLPLVGKLIFVSEIARFSIITSNLLNAGMPFVQSILLATKTFKNKAILHEFAIVNQNIVEGKSLSKSLQNITSIDIPKSFVHSVGIGESSGNLPEMMDNIAEIYTYDMKNKKDKFLALLEPSVILFMGVVVGFIVMSMLLPIFSINFK